MPGITVTQACKSYETSHYTVKAVNHADLSVESGEAVAIVGPSGAHTLSRQVFSVSLNAAIRHLNDPVTAFGNRRVVRNDDQRLAAFLAEPHEDVHDIRFVRRVQ